MPDLPTPKDATEAAQFTECWDAVLCYAGLCAAGPADARQLAREAFAFGMRQARDAGSAIRRGPGRRAARLPPIPLLLTAVRLTAADWEAEGLGGRLDAGLRGWLHSDRASRHSGPSPRRPPALRGLHALTEADAELLWLAEVEALPPRAVARRLGLAPAAAAQETERVRSAFRDRCRRNHLEAQLDAACRSYARLLDAVLRDPAADAPEDLARHLASCAHCAETADCLRPDGGGVPAALADGVIGWGGRAYLERRRRSAEVWSGADLPAPPDRGSEAVPAVGGRARLGRWGILAAAALVSLAALTVSMLPLGGSGHDTLRNAGNAAADSPAAGAPGGGSGDGRPVAGAAPVRPPSPTASPAPSAPSASSAEVSSSPLPAATAAGVTAGRPVTVDEGSDPEPQGSPSAAAGGGGGAGATPSCEVGYRVVNQWSGGFQAAVTLTTAEALDSWTLTWTFRDGQRVTQTWDASAVQNGDVVTVTGADYDSAVPADGSRSFGFLGTRGAANTAPSGIALNGSPCAVTG
ncbi:cellulose binding domain-containing protein [Streptomyces sp. MS06]|uniref:cellulose binding domain-containing protein n=1 Tax=Streptomyces sp. MS06 TaxID=3385974 RepID=UPI0039A268AE